MAGRHRAPVTSRTGRNVARVAVAGSLAAAAPVGVAMAPAHAAEAFPAGAVAMCESSGNPRSVGPVTAAGGHFGLFQFDLPTWRSVGGTGNPVNASAAEQTARAQTLHAQRGMQPWLASASCWRTAARGVVPASVLNAGAVRAAPAPSSVPSRARTAPAREQAVREANAVPSRTGARTHRVQAGETLSGIAAAHGTSVRSIAQHSHLRSGNVNLIFPGEVVTL